MIRRQCVENILSRCYPSVIASVTYVQELNCLCHLGFYVYGKNDQITYLF